MQISHMNKGDGDTSYAKNSLFQNKILSLSSSMVECAIDKIMSEVHPKSMEVADLGCSSGPNSLTKVYEIIHIVDVVSRRMGLPIPELRVSLNDLPCNDFNLVFEMLPELYNKVNNDYGIESCYVCGVPGSFYGRLFPNNSLHFVHSSMSLHWLSQVPLDLEPSVGSHINKENIYISKCSSENVVKAYQRQYQDDMSLFFKLRAKEIVVGGRMVLSFLGRRSPEPRATEACYNCEILSLALMSMALDGLIEKEKIDSFNLPSYLPSQEEVEHEIEKQGSFKVERVEGFEMEHIKDPNNLNETTGSLIAKILRSVMEPMFMSHFQFKLEMSDELFVRFVKLYDHRISQAEFLSFVWVFSLSKKMD
ncbi:probable jasmonic acid carboxyl methyltransferase 2 [Rutidosis leptorrhynchoides]|uniref:probable jasmonic acid carboxyl methyltransferase 2 n=1 Tax=Rutidosis leptorrhynchoides TaxID=125765 RepID=UPI003A9A05DE